MWLRVLFLSFFPSRTLGLKHCSFPTAPFLVMHVYQYLQKFPLCPTPPIPSSPSSPVFLSLRPPLSPASTDLSRFLSSCVSKIHTGGQCQRTTPEWEERVTWQHINRGNSSSNLSFSLRDSQQSWDSRPCIVMVRGFPRQSWDVR